MVGVSLVPELDAAAIRDRALALGLVCNVPGRSMLRFLPPLTIAEADIDEALDKLRRALA